MLKRLMIAFALAMTAGAFACYDAEGRDAPAPEVVSEMQLDGMRLASAADYFGDAIDAGDAETWHCNDRLIENGWHSCWRVSWLDEQAFVTERVDGYGVHRAFDFDDDNSYDVITRDRDADGRADVLSLDLDDDGDYDLRAVWHADGRVYFALEDQEGS